MNVGDREVWMAVKRKYEKWNSYEGKVAGEVSVVEAGPSLLKVFMRSSRGAQHTEREQ